MPRSATTLSFCTVLLSITWCSPGLRADRMTPELLWKLGRLQGGVISPDGKLVAYEYRDEGMEQIYLTTFPNAEGRWQVSVSSGTEPRWSSKGDEIFYIEVGSYSLMSVAVAREPTLKLGTPRKLFSGLTPGVALYAGYDVDADAQRFLMVQINDPYSDKRGIAIVENWFEEFRNAR